MCGDRPLVGRPRHAHRRRERERVRAGSTRQGDLQRVRQAARAEGQRVVIGREVDRQQIVRLIERHGAETAIVAKQLQLPGCGRRRQHGLIGGIGRREDQVLRARDEHRNAEILQGDFDRVVSSGRIDRQQRAGGLERERVERGGRAGAGDGHVSRSVPRHLDGIVAIGAHERECRRRGGVGDRFDVGMDGEAGQRAGERGGVGARAPLQDQRRGEIEPARQCERIAAARRIDRERSGRHVGGHRAGSVAGTAEHEPAARRRERERLRHVGGRDDDVLRALDPCVAHGETRRDDAAVAGRGPGEVHRHGDVAGPNADIHRVGSALGVVDANGRRRRECLRIDGDHVAPRAGKDRERARRAGQRDRAEAVVAIDQRHERMPGPRAGRREDDGGVGLCVADRLREAERRRRELDQIVGAARFQTADARIGPAAVVVDHGVAGLEASARRERELIAGDRHGAGRSREYDLLRVVQHGHRPAADRHPAAGRGRADDHLVVEVGADNPHVLRRGHSGIRRDDRAVDRRDAGNACRPHGQRLRFGLQLELEDDLVAVGLLAGHDPGEAAAGQKLEDVLLPGGTDQALHVLERQRRAVERKRIRAGDRPLQGIARQVVGGVGRVRAQAPEHVHRKPRRQAAGGDIHRVVAVAEIDRERAGRPVERDGQEASGGQGAKVAARQQELPGRAGRQRGMVGVTRCGDLQRPCADALPQGDHLGLGWGLTEQRVEQRERGDREGPGGHRHDLGVAVGIDLEDDRILLGIRPTDRHHPAAGGDRERILEAVASGDTLDPFEGDAARNLSREEAVDGPRGFGRRADQFVGPQAAGDRIDAGERDDVVERADIRGRQAPGVGAEARRRQRVAIGAACVVQCSSRTQRGDQARIDPEGVGAVEQVDSQRR